MIDHGYFIRTWRWNCAHWSDSSGWNARSEGRESSFNEFQYYLRRSFGATLICFHDDSDHRWCYLPLGEGRESDIQSRASDLHHFGEISDEAVRYREQLVNRGRWRHLEGHICVAVSSTSLEYNRVKVPCGQRSSSAAMSKTSLKPSRYHDTCWALVVMTYRIN